MKTNEDSSLSVSFNNGLVGSLGLMDRQVRNEVPMHVSANRSIEYFPIPARNPKRGFILQLKKTRLRSATRKYTDYSEALFKRGCRGITPAHVLHAVLYNREILGCRRIVFILTEPIKVFGSGVGGKANVTEGALVWNGLADGRERMIPVLLEGDIGMPDGRRFKTVARLDIYDQTELSQHMRSSSPLGSLSVEPVSVCSLVDSWVCYSL